MTRTLAILAACLIVALGAEALARAYQAASRGELPVLQWGGER